MESKIVETKLNDKKKEKKDKKRREKKEKNVDKTSKKKDKKDKKDKDKNGQAKDDSSKKRRRDSVLEETPTKKQKLESSNPKSVSIAGDASSFKPCQSFSDAGFSADLLTVTKGFSQPTPIQAQCWPILLAKRDVVGIAETGSGKTLAFGLPGLMHIKTHPQRKPCMLVLAPTRELAQQNHEVLAAAAATCSLQSVCLYGGMPKGPQISALRSGAQVVVGCPGRILDLATEGNCDLSGVTYLVLDEADRMLDMGFELAVRSILGLIKQKRQTVMFSATWPLLVQQLAAEFLVDPIRVTIGSEELSANSNVKQIVEVIEMEARDQRLLELLSKYHSGQNEKVLVFALYKKEATRLESFLKRKGWKCTSIHGDKTSVARSEALEAFKASRPPLLIATDVAARGLDIPKVAYVINYSFPLTVEDYVHRIGRTGRAGATGISHTFFHKFDKPHSGELIGVLKKTGQNVPEELMQFGTHVKKKEPKIGRIDVNATSSRITFDSDSDD